MPNPIDPTLPPDDDRLERMLAGDVPESGAERPAEIDAADELRALLREATASPERGRPMDERLAKLMARVSADKRGRRASSGPHRLSIWHQRAAWSRVAGAVAGLFVLVLGYSTITHWRATPSTAVAPSGSTVVARRGEAVRTRLPDGTSVVLASESRLTYNAAAFASDVRTVYLDGRAVFQVVHDAAHPFAVETHNTTITDVGTIFDVRAYPDEKTVRVAVLDGSVRIDAKRDGDRPLATAGDVATISSAGVTIRPGADVRALASWTTGTLVFRDVALRDVVPDLARWYDLDVTVPDSSMGSIPVTASFGDEPVSQVLEALALAVDGEYTRHGRTITLTPRRHVK